MHVDMGSFVTGGYFITKTIDRPLFTDADLLPPRMVSATSCLATFVPDDWAISWVSVPEEERLEYSQTFGLSAERMSELVDWVTGRFDVELGWPNVCFSLDTVRDLARTFLEPDPERVIMGLGLHTSLVGRFVEVAKPPPAPPGYSPMGPDGLYTSVTRRQAMAPGGQPLGFEPLTYERCLSCSWLCNGLERDAWRELGIRPNGHGFIETWEEALACVEYISRDDVGAEPGLWLPWLVVRYP